jgi:hypothetical protein
MAEMIAGLNIIYLPGTSVQEGGYMHGYISDVFCGQASPTVVTVVTGKDEDPAVTESLSFMLYPNPTKGDFTIVRKQGKIIGNITIEVYNMQGERVMSEQMIGAQSHDILLSYMNSGLYFVKIIAGDYIETIKLVKTR